MHDHPYLPALPESGELADLGRQRPSVEPEVVDRALEVGVAFCANDQMALGALQSLEANKATGRIKLVGFDGAIEATQQIIAHKMFATIAQDPYGMAKIAVQEAVARSDGKTVRKTVNTGDPLVTQQNAKAYFKVAERKRGNPSG